MSNVPLTFDEIAFQHSWEYIFDPIIELHKAYNFLIWFKLLLEVY